MLNSFLPQHISDLADSLFGSIVGLLEFLLFLIGSFEVVVLGHYILGGTVELASEIRDLCFHYFHIRNALSTPFTSWSFTHNFSLLLFLPVIL